MVTKVVATAYGGPEVLALIETDLAPLRPGDVHVAVRAIGTNPVDYKLFSGNMGHDPSALPLPVGYEAAGVVVAAGDEASGPAGSIGVVDEVIAFRVNGAYASDLVAPGRAIVPKPSTFSFEEASGLLLTGGTAVHALHATGVAQGDTLLVHGASGGVGQLVVQLAVASGARVIGTASAANHDELRGLGAEPVVYGDGLADRVRALAPAGVTAAIDTVGTDEALEVSLALVLDKARIATIANAANGLAAGIKTLGMAPGSDPGTEVRDASRLQLTALAEEGGLTVKVARTYPLVQAADALRELSGGHANGKIILIP